jgi:hypothetical protein
MLLDNGNHKVYETNTDNFFVMKSFELPKSTTPDK